MKKEIGNRFKVLLVRNSKLLAEAQSLRQRVFFKTQGRDEDKFDKFCTHLVVIDKNINKAVGTYRLLLGSVAKKNLGFYSQEEFDLRNINKNCKGELLEMGRACVDASYRKFPIINLMWKEIISFVAKNKVAYIFGCASIDEPSSEKIGALSSYFKEHHFAPNKFRVYPLDGKVYPYVENAAFIKTHKGRGILKFVPSLIYGYMRMGAYVCSEPVWDREFNTADFFMLLDTAKMNAFYKKKFS